MGRGDPSRDDVVGVVGQVVADERIAAFVIVIDVRSGERDELAVAGRRRVLGRATEQWHGIDGEQRSDDEQVRRGRGRGTPTHQRGRDLVAADGPVHKVVELILHASRMGVAADGVLTMR